MRRKIGWNSDRNVRVREIICVTYLGVNSGAPGTGKVPGNARASPQRNQKRRQQGATLRKCMEHQVKGNMPQSYRGNLLGLEWPNVWENPLVSDKLLGSGECLSGRDEDDLNRFASKTFQCRVSFQSLLAFRLRISHEFRNKNKLLAA